MPPTLPLDFLPPSLSSIPNTPLLSSTLPLIQPLPRLTSHIVPDTRDTTLPTHLYLYREDLTSPLAFGGNKIRKLEYVVPRSYDPRVLNGKPPATALLTEGGIQSNHTRQTAAAAASLGLKCVLLLSPWTESSDPNYEALGNLQLCRMLRAEVRMLRKDEVDGASVRVKEELEGNGETVAWIPAGASLHEYGGVGYARWSFELLHQEQVMREKGVFGKSEGFAWVVVTCVSGSTLGGMVAELKLAEKSGLLRDRPQKLRLLGIDGSAKEIMGQRDLVLGIAKTTGRLIGLSEAELPTIEDVAIDGQWNAGKYGHCDESTKEAMRLIARMEGVITDPVYTGKGVRGMLERVKEGSLQGNVLFVHPGGQPALSVYGGVERD